MANRNAAHLPAVGTFVAVVSHYEHMAFGNGNHFVRKPDHFFSDVGFRYGFVVDIQLVVFKLQNVSRLSDDPFSPERQDPACCRLSCRQ